MLIKGISRDIVNQLVERTNELGQGRNAGCIGFVNSSGYVNQITDILDGGLGGVPLRMLLNKLVPMEHLSLLEGIDVLPPNAVFVVSRPGRTGLITDVNGVDLFNIPVISVGVKEDRGVTGVGIIYPESRFFDLATKTELIDLETLAASTMDEERQVLKETAKLSLEYLDVSHELAVVDIPLEPFQQRQQQNQKTPAPRYSVRSMDKELAERLVETSLDAGSGREVAIMGQVDRNGHVRELGRPVVGGIGYVPSRILASSAVDISGKSLREIYSNIIPENAVIVHTHPGGTGVMHMGDANAGPGTLTRPIIAIGHDRDGTIKGATTIEVTEKLFQLVDEDEVLNQEFYGADTPEQEAEIRNRKLGIAQEYTLLSQPIEMI